MRKGKQCSDGEVGGSGRSSVVCFLIAPMAQAVTGAAAARTDCNIISQALSTFQKESFTSYDSLSSSV